MPIVVGPGSPADIVRQQGPVRGIQRVDDSHTGSVRRLHARCRDLAGELHPANLVTLPVAGDETVRIDRVNVPHDWESGRRGLVGDRERTGRSRADRPGQYGSGGWRPGRRAAGAATAAAADASCREAEQGGPDFGVISIGLESTPPKSLPCASVLSRQPTSSHPSRVHSASCDDSIMTRAPGLTDCRLAVCECASPPAVGSATVDESN
jgi:hypothetical protein